MIVYAKGSFVRISPSKVRQVINLLRGQEVNAALATLSSINRRPKVSVEKILKSAISNAKQKGLQPEQLYISKIVANEGVMWKRFRAVPFGRAARIRKRTSHIKIELDLK
ncbi:50S ribosomal protein L22 [Candidatus Omnitrophota bacterium]